jgi:hypothetical protein
LPSVVYRWGVAESEPLCVVHGQIGKFLRRNEPACRRIVGVADRDTHGTAIGGSLP